MKTRYHFNRQRRQLIHLGKSIARLRAAGRMETEKQRDRFRTLCEKLVPSLGKVALRRALGTSAVLLGLSFGATAQVANFNVDPVVNPFGLDSIPGVITYFSEPTLADIDGDGDLDLLMRGYDIADLQYKFVYRQNIGSITSPAFAQPTFDPFGLSVGTDGIGISLVDLDQDGDLDLLETGFNYQSPDDSINAPIILYRENVGVAGSPSFSEPIEYPFQLEQRTNENAMFFTFGDLDGDGDLDILAEECEEDGGISINSCLRNFFYKNLSTNGGGVSFDQPEFFPFGLDSIPQSTSQVLEELVDLDNDGDLDILGSTYERSNPGATLSRVCFVENMGTPTIPRFGQPVFGDAFGLTTFELSTKNLARLEFGDLDGDGDLDLMVNTDDEGFVYYENGSLVSGRDQAVEVALTLSPNPTTDLVIFTTEEVLAGVRVHDGLGRLVRSYSGSVRQIDMHELPAGTYHVRLMLPDQSFGVRRVVKL